MGALAGPFVGAFFAFIVFLALGWLTLPWG